MVVHVAWRSWWKKPKGEGRADPPNSEFIELVFEHDLSARWAVELVILDPIRPCVAAAGRIQDRRFEQFDKLLRVCKSVHGLVVGKRIERSVCFSSWWCA